MLSQRNKMVEVSRFKTPTARKDNAYTRDSPRMPVRFNTETEEDEHFSRTFSNKKSFTSRLSTDLSLENLLRAGSKRRKMYLNKIQPQKPSIFKPSFLQSPSFLSKQ